MSGQTFIDEINLTIDNLNENLFGAKILYDMCNDKLHPWGNEAQLRDKLCIISRVYEHPLREGFICYGTHEVNGKKRSRHRQINVFELASRMLSQDKAYGRLIGKVADMGWSFSFDGSLDDAERLVKSLLAVLEFNDLLAQTLCSFDELHRQPVHDRSNNFAPASKFLHFHRPAQFFVSDRDIRSGITNLRSENGCRIGETVIDGETKKEILETYRHVLWFLQDGLKVLENEKYSSPQAEYLRAMVQQYAIGCYIRAHSDKIDGAKLKELPSISLLTAELLSSIFRLKTQEEVEAIAKELNPDTPIEEIFSHCRDSFEFEQLLAAYRKQNGGQ